ncbi:MAG: pesticin C-terminus-like muramidase [Byssovorax sp.]
MANSIPFGWFGPLQQIIRAEIEALVKSESSGLKIDWAFISAREGGERLDGYFPPANRSKSGVTIATGFDIGQRSKSDLERLVLSQVLVNKLSPYCGHTGSDAKEYVRKHPLNVTPAEARAIDKASKREATERLVRRYDAASEVKFEALPAEAQTVIASVEFQYGSIQTKRNTFWLLVIAQDWSAAVKKLRHFGDDYKTRRKKEADLLEGIVAADE